MTLLRLDLPSAAVLTVGALSLTATAAWRPAATLPTGPPSGVIEGMVRLEIPPLSAPTVMNPYARRRYRPPAEASASAETPEGVVVFVPVEPGSASRRGGEVRIVQRDRRILPATSAVQVGTRVEFPNEDDVYHNLFSLSEPNDFNLGRYPPGKSAAVVFDEPGVVRMFCDIHSEMTGVILVLDTPYFVSPDAEGRYRLQGVPDGPHTVVAWHAVAGADSVQVVVEGSGVVQADFTLGN